MEIIGRAHPRRPALILRRSDRDGPRSGANENWRRSVREFSHREPKISSQQRSDPACAKRVIDSVFERQIPSRSADVRQFLSAVLDISRITIQSLGNHTP